MALVSTKSVKVDKKSINLSNKGEKRPTNNDKITPKKGKDGEQ